MTKALNGKSAVLRTVAILATAFITAVATSYTAHAQVSSITVTVDENGHGTINGFLGLQPLPFAMQTDTGPGGLTNTMTYSLLDPPGLTAGDVLLQEVVGGPISDLVRFNPAEPCSSDGSTGCLVFYSDIDGGVDALADIGLPSGRYTNVVTLLEVGLEGNNGATYTPVAGQPGFVAGAAAPVTYVLQSDVSVVSEPASLAFLGIGLAGLGVARRRRRPMVG